MSDGWQWYKFSSSLSGSLHIGSGRWGFVLPSRPYVPGWTLWGALVVLLKKTGRWPGGYGEIGRAVNEHCWLGHLFLETFVQTEQEGRVYRYLPAIESKQGGKTVFAWRDSNDRVVEDLLPPTLFRHGVVRSNEQDQDSLGRLFLTETMQARQATPYRLSGIFGVNGIDFLPFQKKDRLRIGGNRQVNGAEIICLDVQLLNGDEKNEVEKDNLLGLQHLLCQSTNNTLTGEMERIVLRRTRSSDGKRTEGFGQHFVDWGCHLAPGWEVLERHGYAPVRKDAEGFRHGTVEKVLLENGGSSC